MKKLSTVLCVCFSRVSCALTLRQKEAGHLKNLFAILILCFSQTGLALVCGEVHRTKPRELVVEENWRLKPSQPERIRVAVFNPASAGRHYVQVLSDAGFDPIVVVTDRLESMFEMVAKSMVKINEYPQRERPGLLRRRFSEWGRFFRLGGKGQPEGKDQPEGKNQGNPFPEGHYVFLPDFNGDLDLLADHLLKLGVKHVVSGTETHGEVAQIVGQKIYSVTANQDVILKALQDKAVLAKVLEKAGLPFPRGRVVRFVEDAIAFFIANGRRPVVGKPLDDAGARGNKVLESIQAIGEYFAEIFNHRTHEGKLVEEVLIQEKMQDREFAVNFRVVDGEFFVDSLIEYDKREVEVDKDKYKLYWVNRFRDPTKHPEFVKAALEAARAVGFKNGVVHAEVMLNSEGVATVIDMGFRPAGGAFEPAQKVLIGKTSVEMYVENLLAIEKGRRLRPVGKFPTDKFVATFHVANIDPKAIMREDFEEHLKSLLGDNYAGFVSRFKDKGGQLLNKSINLETMVAEIIVVAKTEKQLEQVITRLKELEAAGELVRTERGDEAH
ncbi:MAG: hypothetical protein C5B49_01630 [Bdellovibrio sp.]|nr:MAG: hypothetical protein C5B49_01630 [Bdellovibrio sp.]